MSDTPREHLAAGERAGMSYSFGQPRHAPSGLGGTTMGQRAGSSLEFREYRDYQPGDDIRHIDWSAYARSDQLSIKLFREEVTPHLDLVLDNTRSMALPGSRKAEAALGLAAFLATAAANGGYSHRAWLFGERIRPVGNGNARPLLWDGVDFSDRAVAAGQGNRQSAWRARGTRILISDLLWPGEPLSVLEPLADRAAAVVVIQVLAEADVSPSANGSVRMIDTETEEVRELLVDAAVLNRYRAALARHQQNWSQACRQFGGMLVTVIAEKFLVDWKLDELVAADLLKVG